MPSKFKESWLGKSDCNKTVVGLWARKEGKDAYSCMCRICNKSFKIDKGFDRINQHAKSAIHRLNLSKLKSQLTLTSKATSQTPSSTDTTNFTNGEAEDCRRQNISNMKTCVKPDEQQVICNNSTVENEARVPNKLTLYNPRDEATKAELLWCLELITTKGSTNSCTGKKELFTVMFPNSIQNSFSLSPKKASYLITDALGPYFHSLLLVEIQKNNVKFTLQFDETSNVKTKKELQIRVIYWSDADSMVVNRYLETRFIERGDGDTLFKYLISSLDSNNLSLKQILTLGIDGPNVNKKVMRLFQEKLKDLNHKSLINIGSCSIHTVHNAYLKGLDSLFIDVSDFIIKIYYFFHHKDLRWSNYERIQNDLKLPGHKFEKHVSTRWLTIGPAAERILEQYSGLEEYFLKFVPIKDSSTAKKQSYLDILRYLKDPNLRCILQFTSYVAHMFTVQLTLLFQKDEPLIHMLYSQLRKLVMIMMTSIVKQESTDFSLSPKIFDDNNIEKVLADSSKSRPLLDIDCGEKVKLLSANLAAKDKLVLMSQIQKFYKAAILHINNKISNRRTLKYLQCLCPENIKNPESSRYINEVAKSLPLDDVDLDVLTCEWKLLQVDEDVCFLLKPKERIDVYWNRIFQLKISSETRYPLIACVVKAALSLPHGNAAVERGFSESGLQLTEDKASMIERTLNAKLRISDYMKKYNYLTYMVPITKDLIKLGQNAHRSYNNYLEENRKIEEEKRKQETMNAEDRARELSLLKTLNKEIKTIETLKLELETAKKICNEDTANTSSMQKVLNDATKKKLSPQVIQQLISSLNTLISKEKNARKKVDELQDILLKKNASVLKTAVAKKIKNIENME